MSDQAVLAEVKLTGYDMLYNPIRGMRYLIGQTFEHSIHHCDRDLVWTLTVVRIVKENVDLTSIDVEPIEWCNENFHRIQHSLYYPRHMVETPKNDEEN